MTADLSALIARLEAAEVGSRELDCEVGLFARTDGKGEVSNHFGTPCIRDAAGPYAPRPYTTSLDAALALAERTIQGDFFWSVHHNAVAVGQKLYRAEVIFSGCGWQSGASRSASLALVSAILRAKQGEGE